MEQLLANEINKIATKKEFENFVLNSNLQSYLFDKLNEEERERVCSLIEKKAKEVSKATFWIEKYKEMVKSKKREKADNTKNNFTDFDKQPIRIFCGGWVANNYDGIGRYTNSGELQIATYTPVLITKRIIDIENDIEYVELSYYDLGEWRTKKVPREYISNSRMVCKLSNYGINITSESSSLLVKYLTSLYDTGKDIIPVYYTINNLGWQSEKFDEFAPYVYDKDNKIISEKLSDVVKDTITSGSLETWRENVQKVRKNKNVRVYLAASFASPLVKLLNINGFITHLYGDRGKGKTVSLMLAMSIWGNPELGKLTNSVNSTLFALETRASLLQNIPLSGDELINLNKKEMNYDDLIYMISNGVGKGRGTKDGTVDEIKHWNLIMMTTGENTITSDNSHSGSKVRCVEIENNEEMYNGINLAQLSEIVKFNYGYAGEKYVKYLIQLGKENIRQRFVKIKEKMIENSSTPLDSKQLNALACLKLADELASESLFEKEEELAIMDILILIKDELEINVAARAKEYIISEIMAERNSFDVSGEEMTNRVDRGRVKGKRDGNLFYVNNNELKNMLDKAGFSFNEIKQKWVKMGFLIPYKNTHIYYNYMAKYGSVVKLKINLEEEKEEIDYNDLPF